VGKVEAALTAEVKDRFKGKKDADLKGKEDTQNVKEKSS